MELAANRKAGIGPAHVGEADFGLQAEDCSAELIAQAGRRLAGTQQLAGKGEPS
jgi:hypothetical protein